MRRASLVVLVAFVVVGLLVPAEAGAQFTVPNGFDDQAVVAGLSDPTALAWLPPGEGSNLLITTQGGGIYRFTGTPPAQLLLDLSGTICSGGETGLLGIAVHPDFGAGQRFIYVYYTDRKGNDGCSEPNDRANRVSRFTMNDQDQLVSEEVLIDNIPARGGNHNGGDIQFGADELLYVSVGDSGQDLRTGESQDDNRNARRLDLLNGKILRITPNGGIPNGNPFQGPDTARCSATGSLERQGDGVSAEKKSKQKKRKAKKRKRQRRQNRGPATVCQEIFATGLRNPYRIAFDSNDTSGAQRFYINDVGGDGFEEVNVGRAGGDYGWNVREGPCPIDDISNDCSNSSEFDDPVFAYRRNGPAPFGSCRTITGGAFVPNSSWPAAYDDVYLFADLFCGTVFALRDEGPGEAPEQFATGENVSHLAFGPDGALYYTALFDDAVRRIVVEP